MQAAMKEVSSAGGWNAYCTWAREQVAHEPATPKDGVPERKDSNLTREETNASGRR